MKLYPKHRKSSKHDNRFYTAMDMAIVKHDSAVKNSRIKRGETERKGNEYIMICGCGAEGCFLHIDHDNNPQEWVNMWEKNRNHHSGETRKERKERKEKERKQKRKETKVLKNEKPKVIKNYKESDAVQKINWDLLMIK